MDAKHSENSLKEKPKKDLMAAGQKAGLVGGVTSTLPQGRVRLRVRPRSVHCQTCLLILRAVACLHNALLPCLPHNGVECQQRLGCARGHSGVGGRLSVSQSLRAAKRAIKRTKPCALLHFEVLSL